MRYRLSLLQAKQALLNATNKELSSKTTADVNKTLNEISRSLSEIRTLINNGVQKLLHMEVECFTKVNLSVCETIIEGHAAFKSLLLELGEHFAQAEYLESILNGRPQVLQVIQQKLSEVESDIKLLDLQIKRAETAEASEHIEASTSIDPHTGSCPGVGQIKFTFNSHDFDSAEHCQEDPETGTDACVDIAIPVNATDRNLWDMHSCFVDGDLKTFGAYDRFLRMMNSVPVKLTASLLKVNVHRPWFDISIFEDSDHFTMVSYIASCS